MYVHLDAWAFFFSYILWGVPPFFSFPNHGTLCMWGRGRIMNMLLLLNIYLQVLSCELNFPAAPVSIARPPTSARQVASQTVSVVCMLRVTVRWAGTWGEFALLCKWGVVGSEFLFFWSDYCMITNIQFVVLINIMVCDCVCVCVCAQGNVCVVSPNWNVLALLCTLCSVHLLDIKQVSHEN